jgi:hypothetical protein
MDSDGLIGRLRRRARRWRDVTALAAHTKSIIGSRHCGVVGEWRTPDEMKRMV